MPATARQRLLADPGPAALEDSLRRAVGYSVVAPEGDVGVVVAVPASGRPTRPLVLVVRCRDTIRFVSLRRVAGVESFARRVALGPEMGPLPDGGVRAPG